ncbi:MAG: hypothetical protein R6U61_02575 [Thermoplasmata archaeon]
MKSKKITVLVSLMALMTALMLLTPTIASAQYSDEITDPTGDVDHWRVTDTGGYGWRENVERPDVDIVRVSIEESGGNLTVELEVKGTIQSDAQEDSYFMYVIELENGDGESYDITYSFGQIYFEWPGGTEYGFTEPTGFGTSTLQVSFLLEEYGNPDSLEISGVTTYEYTGSAGTGEYYMDEASPGSDDSSNGDGSSDDLTDEEKDMLDKLWAGSMLCIALAVIIPIVIVVIIIIVLVKVMGGDKDEGQSQQQGYQQGPPPGQPPAQQQQPPQQQSQQPPQESTPPPPPESENTGDEW